MAETYKLRVGLLGVGLEAYWTQFARLEDRLKGKHRGLVLLFFATCCPSPHFGVVSHLGKKICHGYPFLAAALG